MTTTYDWLTDTTTVASVNSVDLLSAVTRPFVVITTVVRSPDYGSAGIKVTDGTNSLFFSFGPLEGTNVITIPASVGYIAVQWSSGATYIPFFSTDGIDWHPWVMPADVDGIPLPYPAFPTTPTQAGMFLSTGATTLEETVEFGSARVMSGLLLVEDVDTAGLWRIPSEEEMVAPIGTLPTSQPDLVTSSEEAIVHALVGAPFGDLEFDVGKSVGWLSRFVDDLFVTDLNSGDQRYWVVNWTQSFQHTYYKFSGKNFFVDPVAYRKGQLADAFQYAADHPDVLTYDDTDWVIFLDAHEGLSTNTTSKPDDYLIAEYKSYIYREIARANAAGKDRIILPFFAFLRHDHIQNVGQSYEFEGESFTVTQAAGVPYYLPYQGLTRMFKVSALKNPAFDWSILDKTATLPTPVLRDPGYLHLSGTRGNWVIATRTTLPTFNTLQFTIHCKLDQMPHTTVSLMGFLAGTNYLLMNADGGMQIISWTAVGANTVLAGNLASSGVAPIKVGVPIWLRGKLTYTTALCEYWYSYDGQTWTSIGAVTGFNAGTLPYLSNSASVMIGNISQSIQPFPGDIYEAYDTIDGVNRIRFVADQDLKTWTSGTSFTTTSGDPALIYGGMNAATKPAFFPGGANGNYLALNTYGVASTADPGPLPNEFVLVAEAALATAPPLPTYPASFASQYHADPQRSWAWKRNSLNSGSFWTAAPTGTSAGATTRTINYFTTGTQGTTELCAMSVILNNGSGNSVFQNWKSTDNGVTWVSASNPTTFPTIVPFDSNELLRIGGWVSYEINQGPIYNVEAHSGLDPKGGGTSQSVPGYITLPTVTGNYVSTPHYAGLNVTDMTVIVRLRPTTDWTTSQTGRTIISKTVAGSGSWLWRFQGGPVFPIFSWSADGTNFNSASPALVYPFAATDQKYLAITIDVDNGAAGRDIRFFYSDDMVTWTPHGTVITQAGITSIFNGTAPLEIGRSTVATTPFTGNFSFVSIRNGIGAAGVPGGTEVFRYDAATDISPTISPTATSFIAYTGQTMTVNRAGSPATAIVPATAGLLWKCDAAEAAAGISARTDMLLNVDSDADGIADGWVVYSGTSVNNKSVSVVDGYQRIVGAPTAINMVYGVQQPLPYYPVVAGQSYAFEAIFKMSGATPRNAAHFFIWWFDAGNVQGTSIGSPNFRVNSDGWVRALWFGTAPAGAVSARIIARIIGLAGTTGTETVTLDVKQISAIPLSWTIRGRLWTLHNPDALITAGTNPVPLANTVIPPRWVTDVKIQLVSYAYAHWCLQDIPPGEVRVPPLSALNDDGWKQRCSISQVLPIVGLPSGNPIDPVGTWVSPAADVTGVRGPWAFDTYADKVTDPDIPDPPPPLDPAAEAIMTPMYDLVFRLNVRDGVWYGTGGLGNTQLVWNDDLQEFIEYGQPVPST